jgi:hypothetical protein
VRHSDVEWSVTTDDTRRRRSKRQLGEVVDTESEIARQEVSTPIHWTFRITEVIESQACRLALPEQYSRLHDVFPRQESMPMPERD